MKLSSSAFKEGDEIPSIYTCEGRNINPPLTIEAVPFHTLSLVLIMEDPDVPAFIRTDGLWVHWIVYNLPSNLTLIKENSKPPGLEGKGSNEKVGYQGPCPPDREHRYFFKLYALGIVLPNTPGLSKLELEHLMKNHILEETFLMGRYKKKKGSSES